MEWPTFLGMEITLNGEKHHLGEPLSVVDLLRTLELDPEKVAVELDGRIVRVPDWGGVMVREGAVVEVVQFVGGG